MLEKMNKQQIAFGLGLVVLAAALKVITFPFSVNPIIAIALFSGATIKDRKLSFALPLLAMFLSDVMLEVSGIATGFYGLGQLGNYASLMAVTVFGFAMQKSNALRVIGFSVGSSLLFFLLSNSSVYFFDSSFSYGKGFAGWAACITAGIPFVKNALVTDLSFSVVIFGSYYLLTKNANQKAKA